MTAPTAVSPYRRPDARQRPADRLSRGSRGIPATVVVRATHIADLVDEITALEGERRDLGRELAGLSTIAYRGGLVDDPSLITYVAGRLDAIAKSIERKGAA